VASAHDEKKWSLMTMEFWAMVLLIVAILIAAAVSGIDDVRAWLLITIVDPGHSLSCGIAKAGTDHWPAGQTRLAGIRPALVGGAVEIQLAAERDRGKEGPCPRLARYGRTGHRGSWKT
jgi:hypothetical protein